MDPANNNPAPNEVPAAPAPAAPAAPVAPAPEAPAAPAPAAPVAPAAPTVNPDVVNAALNPPVNPVVAPAASAAAPAAAPVAPATPTVPGAPATMSMNQMFQSQPANAAGGVFDETTAISVPEGPKPVDPVEEELKAPLKAAAPAPGSIGSAVSGPADTNAPQNNAPVDPNNPMTANVAPQVKKGSILNKLMAKTKMNKTTLILLAAVAGLIVVGLVIVLVMVATGSL